MNRQILEKSVQAFLKANREKNPGDLALKKSPFQTVNASELAVQIDGWQRSVRKLPTWAFSQGVYYPNRIHLEQRSEEHTSELQSRENLVCRLLLETKKDTHVQLNTKISAAYIA